MKKALNLLIIYLLFFLTGLFFGTFLYSFYLNLLNFIAGQENHFFSGQDLYKAIFYVAYCLIFLICPLVSYYRVRHPGGLPQTIVYLVLCLLTWLVFFPCLYKLNNFCDRHFSFEVEDNSLSSGYFRQADDEVYYFTNDFRTVAGGAKEADAVIINTGDKVSGDGDDSSVSLQKVKDGKDFILRQKAEPYNDVLVKDAFNHNGISLPVSFKILVEKLKQSFDDGFGSYLAFLSFALLLCSVYALSSFFEWKLMNTCLLVFVTYSILVVNSFYYLPVLQVLKTKLTSNVAMEKLGNYINDPLIFVINILFTIAFLVVGIIKFAVHKHGKKDN